MFLQTAPHPPPSAQPPEMYPSMNSFRLSAAGPFGQNQGLNNPTGAPATVLISSTSNSLMSASVKPSSQPISAIGKNSAFLHLRDSLAILNKILQEQKPVALAKHTSNSLSKVSKFTWHMSHCKQRTICQELE